MTGPRALVFIGIALALGWAGFRLWLILGGVVPPAPAFADVRAAYRASDLLLLDRRGEVIQEVRTDPLRRWLGWTPLHEISRALRSAVGPWSMPAKWPPSAVGEPTIAMVSVTAGV